MKVAIITPYAGEAPAMIERCRDSVRAQTYADVIHYLVSDGAPRVPRDAQDSTHVRYVDLPVRHQDAGNTPRSVGSLCALNDGADIVCYLDVDNEYGTSHVSAVVEHFKRGSFDVVFAKRRIRLPEYPDAVVTDNADNAGHVDTNCIAIGRCAAFLLPMWGLMPRSVAPIGDTVMMALIRYFSLRSTAMVEATVVYWSTHRYHYASAGVATPPDAKNIDADRVRSTTQSDEVWRRMRITLSIS